MLYPNMGLLMNKMKLKFCIDLLHPYFGGTDIVSEKMVYGYEVRQ